MLKPVAAAIVRKKPAVTPAAVYKKPAGGQQNQQLGLLEVCAYPGSALAKEWAKRGLSAVD